MKLNIDRETYKKLNRHMRKHIPATKRAGGTDPLVERMMFAQRVRFYSEKGKVGIHTSGYDCDWTYGERSRVVNAVPMAVYNFIEKMYAEAEGPISVTLFRPSQYPERSQNCGRNLVEEAFEDGHSHVVYM